VRHLTPTAPLACAMLTAACASPIPTSLAAVRIEIPAEASRPCSLFLLPKAPTQADLEIGYATRGAQIVACDAARRLAVQTNQAEHDLQDRLKSARR